MESQTKPAKRRKPALSALAKITPEELHWLRLDDAAQATFEEHVQRYELSKTKVEEFEREDPTVMSDARYDERMTAEASKSAAATVVIHFLAPRILRLRDGAAKRRWRSVLIKFQKDEGLATNRRAGRT
jgi:predicted DNA-binding protein (UPF0251 family)